MLDQILQSLGELRLIKAWVLQGRKGRGQQRGKKHTSLAARILWIRGNIKAAVFPLPVLALARMSFPARASGIDFAWTGVGFVKLSLARPRNRRSSSPKSAKVRLSSTVLGVISAASVSEMCVEAGGLVACSSDIWEVMGVMVRRNGVKDKTCNESLSRLKALQKKEKNAHCLLIKTQSRHVTLGTTAFILI